MTICYLFWVLVIPGRGAFFEFPGRLQKPGRLNTWTIFCAEKTRTVQKTRMILNLVKPGRFLTFDSSVSIVHVFLILVKPGRIKVRIEALFLIVHVFVHAFFYKKVSNHS